MPSRSALLSALVATALLAGCNRGPDTIEVGVIPKGANHIFWQSVHAGALKAASEYGLEVIWNAPATEVDSARQITIVENLVTRQVDGIVLAPVDQDALVGVVERAAESGIPVSIFDSAINTDKIISYVATDNYSAGAMAARRMGEILGGKGQVGIIGFMPGSASTMAREAGFQETIENEFPDIELVGGIKFPQADRAKALEDAENLMTGYPDLAGLFADNESSTDGTVSAVKLRGMEGKVKVVGFDASDELIREMKAGALDSIVVQDPFKMGYESTKALAMHLRGEAPSKQMDSGSYLLTPENVDTPEMQRIVKPDNDKWLNP